MQVTKYKINWHMKIAMYSHLNCNIIGKIHQTYKQIYSTYISNDFKLTFFFIRKYLYQ